MGLDNIISGTWDKVKDLAERVKETGKKYLGRSLSPDNIQQVDIQRVERPPHAGGIFGARAYLVAVMIAAILTGYAAISRAATINVDPSSSTTTINDTISSSEPNDTIHFTPEGTHTAEMGKCLNFPPNRNYTADANGVTIQGTGEDDSLIQIVNGGNINISGPFTLQNRSVGIDIGTVPYDNIKITDVTFDVYDHGVGMENRQHPSPLEQAAVVISYCTADSADKFVMFAQGGGATENSPYASIVNCTISDMSSSGGAIDVPTYYNDNLGWVMLGNDEINNNVVINSIAISNPDDYARYSSPTNIAQKDVTEPLITGETYYDPNSGEPTVYDGENCFEADANDFVPGTNIPRRDRRLNLGNGNYIGAIKPYHELEGNLNFDEYVDSDDLRLFCGNWLGQGQGDFDGDNTANFSDFRILAAQWYMEEPNDPNGDPK